ncbi:hypothetical protein [Legionella bononiensis]|uniref:hypothetical protein n=1 Tax=Legionella bononiensis TaxID=2793102 RepID=UPI00272D8C6F|nr:hypothetical protein [Legionella bononiensis]
MPQFKLNQAVTLDEFRLLTDWIHRMNNQRIYREDLSNETLEQIFSTIGKIRLIRCNTSFHTLTKEFNGTNDLVNLKIGVNPVYKNTVELRALSLACQNNDPLNKSMVREKLIIGSDYYPILRKIPSQEELLEWVQDDEEYKNILDNPCFTYRIPLFRTTIPLDPSIPISKFNDLVAWIHRIRDVKQTPEDIATDQLREMYKLIGKIRIEILTKIHKYSTGTYLDGRSPRGNMLVGAHKEYANPSHLFNLWQNNTNSVLSDILDDFSLKYWDYKSIVENLPDEKEINSWASFFDLTIQRKLTADGIIVYYKDVQAEINTTIGDFLKKIQLLEQDKHRTPKVLQEAQRLANTISLAANDYLESVKHYPESRGNARKLFINKCSDAIHKAKPILEKELGWGDYLTNLLKSLANALIHVSNYLTGSKCNLFAYATTPLVTEFEELGENLQINLAGS